MFINLNVEVFKKILSNCKKPDTWVPILNSILPKYNINLTINSLSQFIAQTGHESGHYNVLSENLNYSAERLIQIFPKRFPDINIAKQYERNPEKIASRVYANRLGNGPEESKDGWKFRGRGLIQITGKSNYEKCSQFIFKDNRLLDNPDLVSSDPIISVESACWFWVTNNLNQFSDDVEKCTKIINGGTHGLEDRKKLFSIAKKEIQNLVSEKINV